MNRNDEMNFSNMVSIVSEYYGKTLSDEVIELYWKGLKVHDYQDVQFAVTRHMQDPDSGQFMPKIADIKRHISGSKQTQAMLSWSTVDKSIRRIGPWESVSFDDPIINVVISDMGGWIYLCDTKTEKDLEFKMHEFNKRYQGYVLQGGVTEHPHKLIGHTEALNSQNYLEFQSDEPLLIGEYEKALLVHKTGGKTKGLEYRRAADVVAEKVLTLVSNKGEA